MSSWFMKRVIVSYFTLEGSLTISCMIIWGFILGGKKAKIWTQFFFFKISQSISNFFCIFKKNCKISSQKYFLKSFVKKQIHHLSLSKVSVLTLKFSDHVFKETDSKIFIGGWGQNSERSFSLLKFRKVFLIFFAVFHKKIFYISSQKFFLKSSVKY